MPTPLHELSPGRVCRLKPPHTLRRQPQPHKGHLGQGLLLQQTRDPLFLTSEKGDEAVVVRARRGREQVVDPTLDHLQRSSRCTWLIRERLPRQPRLRARQPGTADHDQQGSVGLTGHHTSTHLAVASEPHDVGSGGVGDASHEKANQRRLPRHHTTSPSPAHEKISRGG